MHQLALAAGFATLSYLVWTYILQPAFFSPLSRLPNAHCSSSISPLWILWQRYRDQENRAVHKAHLKHGKIVRLGPRDLSVNSVDDGLHIVYSGGFEKSNWYPNQFHNYSVPCMFSMARSKPHSVRKRMISNIYSKSYIQSSKDLHSISRHIIFAKLSPLLHSKAVKHEPVDVLQLNFCFAMDMINAFIFGLGNGSDFVSDSKFSRTWLTTYQSRRVYRFWDNELPGTTNIARKLGIILVPAWVGQATQYIEDWAMERCRAAQSWTSKQGTFTVDEEKTPALVYDQLNAVVDRNTVHDSTLGPPGLQIASEVLDHLSAGHDTTGITLTYLFWELSRHHIWQQSLHKELLSLSLPIRYTADEGNPDLPSPRSIDQLPLLNAVIMETLRLHPAIPGPQPRITPSSPVSVAGSDPLPPGVRISAQAYSLHRNPDVFEDPEEWKPTRWLTPHKEKKAEMMKWFWAFGSGGRMCIGSHFAMQEMKYMTAAVYTNYSTSVVDDRGIEQLDAYTAGPKGNELILHFELLTNK